MPAGLHPWPSQNTATKLYLVQAGAITKHLMQGTHAAQSRTGQLKADFRYAHFPDNISLHLWKTKKDSNKTCELKDRLPSKQPRMISASNKMEARAWHWAWLLTLSLPHPTGGAGKASWARRWDGFGGSKKPPKAIPNTSYPGLTSPCFFPSPCAFLPSAPKLAFPSDSPRLSWALL